ncbi:hypothetical protein OSTOST_14745 [Ostertagia ostertagi]
MLSALDSSYLMPIDSSTTVEVQLRTISRREGNISKARNGIKEAVEILRKRYQSLLFFAQSQEDPTQINSDIDQFWTEIQGEKLIDDAQETILSLDTQLIMDQNIQASLLSQLNNDMVTTTATLAVTDASRQTNDLPSHENQDCHQRSRTSSSSQEVPPSILQPIQLRPIELPTFDGDTAQFHDFWCRFKTAVHDNDTLSLPTKFIYLTNSLRGSAALIVQGYDLSKPENYHLAIHALRRRYDRPQFTHNLFHHKLEQLQMSTSSASTQRDTLCQIQSFVSQINRYEDTSTSLALMKLIRSKFPKETQLEVNRLEHRSGKTWTLPELLDGLNEVIEEYEKLDDYTVDQPSSAVHANPVTTIRSRSPTPEPRLQQFLTDHKPNSYQQNINSVPRLNHLNITGITKDPDPSLARPTGCLKIPTVSGPIRTLSEAYAKTLRPAIVPFYATASHLPCAVPPSMPYYISDEEVKDNVYADNTIL